jgi:GAF domain-containing protein
MPTPSHRLHDQMRYAALMNHRLTRHIIGDAKSVVLVAQAARHFAVPVACIGLVGREQVHLVAEIGISRHVVPRDLAISPYAILRDAPLVVEDTARDPMFAGHPLVAARGVRFLAAAPLIDREGYRLGAFCLLGREPRAMPAADIADLVRFAARAMARIDFLSMIAELSREAIPATPAVRRAREVMVW